MKPRLIASLITLFVLCTTGALAQDGTLKWVLPTAAVLSSPAIGADGTIYVGSFDGNLYAINANGTEKWAFPTGPGGSVSSPAIGADGTIYVGSEDFNLYAINANGTQKWAFPTGNAVVSSPAIGADGTIYVGSVDGNLYAINANGTEKWAFPTGKYSVMSSPAIGADGTIYVGVTSAPPGFYAINGSSGGLATSPWPMFHHDLKHTGRFESSCPDDDIRLLASYPADLNSNPLAPPVTRPIEVFEFQLSEAARCAGRIAVRFDLNSPEFDVTENVSRNPDGTYTVSIDPLDPAGPCYYPPIETEEIHYITLKADYYVQEPFDITLKFLVVEDALSVRPAEVYEMTPSHSPGDQVVLTVEEGTAPYTWSAVCGTFFPGCLANDVSQCTGDTCTVEAGPYLGHYHVEVTDATNTRTRISVTIEEPPQLDALRLEPNFIVTKVNETVEVGIEGGNAASGFGCASTGGFCQVIFDGQDYKVRYTAGGLAGDDWELKVYENAPPYATHRIPVSLIQPGLAILVTGAGHPPHNPPGCDLGAGTLSDDLELADITNQVYTTFQRGGFSNDAIYFLYGSELPYEEEDPLSGTLEHIKPCWLDSSYGVAARDVLEQAITGWAYTETLTRFDDPQDATLYIYLLDHGTSGETFYLYDAGDRYCANQDGTVNGCDCTAVAEGKRELDPGALRGWIEQYQSDVATATGKAPPTVVVMLDFCYAGSFVDDLDHVPPGSRPGDKIVVASVNPGETTNINRLASFSVEFFNTLERNRTVWDAFEDGSATQENKTPLLDDNNDGMGAFFASSCPSPFDGCVSRGFKPFKQSFGYSFCPPTMMSQGRYMVTAAESEATTLWDHEAPLPTNGENPAAILGAAFDVVVAVPVEVEGDIQRILATVVPPGGELSEAPILTFTEDDDRLTTTLTEYRVTIPGSVLSETGDYQVYCRADYTDGIISNLRHLVLSVQASGSDADGDGVPDGEDNCPEDFNPNQIDADRDGYGWVCDCDDDTSDDLAICRSAECDAPTPDCSTCAKHIHPGATEVQGDGVDNDCDPSTPDSPPWGAATAHAGVVQASGETARAHGPMANTLGAMLLPLFAVILMRKSMIHHQS